MQLSFSFTFAHGGDEVFCSYTVPYTYSEMTSHMESIRTAAERQCKNKYKVDDLFYAEKQFVHFGSIGKSMGGMHIPIIKITNPSSGDIKKPVVMIIGR